MVQYNESIQPDSILAFGLLISAIVRNSGERRVRSNVVLHRANKMK